MSNKDVIIEKKNATVIITLNREKVLNALNLNMVRDIYKNISNWDEDPEVSGVIIKGVGEKAFCAGGDIVSVYHSRNKPDVNLKDNFFREEYILNLSIANFSKPWISILNGIAMGGGLGLSVHGSHRIVNSRTITAMPETAIGLFPDVGGGYFLSRMGVVGTYLALTGRIMDALDSLYVGIGSSYIDDENIDNLIKTIINKNKYDKKFIDGLLTEASNNFVNKKSSLEKELIFIKKHFSEDNIIKIFNSLKKDNSEWAQDTLKVLMKKSPTSMGVVIKQLSIAETLDLKECLSMEFRICQSMMAKHDFYEGVRANLVDKDRNPKWEPRDVSELEENIINEHFDALGDKELLKFE